MFPQKNLARKGLNAHNKHPIAWPRAVFVVCLKLYMIYIYFLPIAKTFVWQDCLSMFYSINFAQRFADQ